MAKMFVPQTQPRVSGTGDTHLLYHGKDCDLLGRIGIEITKLYTSCRYVEITLRSWAASDACEDSLFGFLY